MISRNFKDLLIVFFELYFLCWICTHCWAEKEEEEASGNRNLGEVTEDGGLLQPNQEVEFRVQNDKIQAFFAISQNYWFFVNNILQRRQILT